MVSICSGAFALATAGLLNGRRATTHWRYADLLHQRYPLVPVDSAPLYVDSPNRSRSTCRREPPACRSVRTCSTSCRPRATPPCTG
ncbi:DJ-1/PfpI family protein [Streptomyces sioyaensis]|uniref:DJ-1/PfpI family protein n=1 Tax=Streptomyces sioyaensis TaxID=67364 RepID=UPI0035575430